MKKVLLLVVAAFLVSFLVGYGVSLSHKNIDSKVEYASETNSKFFQKMVNVDKNSTLIFDGFPTCLTSIFNTPLGEEILSTEKDTLFLVFKGLNQQDINRYPYYILKDNHDNVWSLFRHNDKYILKKEDETLL